MPMYGGNIAVLQYSLAHPPPPPIAGARPSLCLCVLIHHTVQERIVAYHCVLVKGKLCWVIAPAINPIWKLARSSIHAYTHTAQFYDTLLLLLLWVQHTHMHTHAHAHTLPCYMVVWGDLERGNTSRSVTCSASSLTQSYTLPSPPPSLLSILLHNVCVESLKSRRDERALGIEATLHHRIAHCCCWWWWWWWWHVCLARRLYGMLACVIAISCQYSLGQQLEVLPPILKLDMTVSDEWTKQYQDGRWSV